MADIQYPYPECQIHATQLDNHEHRIEKCEDRDSAFDKLITKLNTLVDVLMRMFWILTTAVVGSLLSAIVALIRTSGAM